MSDDCTEVLKPTMAGYRAGLRPPNFGAKYPRTLLTPPDVRALIDASGGGSAGIRSRALIGLLYRTGVEPSEALGLHLDDHVNLDIGMESIRIDETRLVPRVLALDEVAMSLLEPWLDVRAQLGGEHLFCTFEKGRRGRPLSHGATSDHFRALASRAGLRLRMHLTAFRHTLAAELLVEGWPFHYLQVQLGVKSLGGAFQTLLDTLNVHRPSDDEVMDLIRSRPPASGITPP